MTREEETDKAEPGLGNLGECLVGGSPEEQARRRKVKRRALAISIVLQSAALTAVVIAPLLAKPAELVVTTTTPIPPYSHAATQRRATNQPRPPRSTGYRFRDPLPITQIIRNTSDSPISPIEPPEIVGSTEGTGPGNHLNIVDTRPQPLRPAEPVHEKKRIRETSIDPAMLIRRVEPVYPPLPKQLHRGGRVELRAVIATDGTIQSLEVVSGDPLFVQSALDAVRQWRYRPTYLNGQPVEIDTFITVIYNVNQ